MDSLAWIDVATWRVSSTLEVMHPAASAASTATGAAVRRDVQATAAVRRAVFGSSMAVLLPATHSAVECGGSKTGFRPSIRQRFRLESGPSEAIT